jgi:predicted helicase
VCSNDAEYEELYEGEELDLSVETTTNPEQIEIRIQEAIQTKIALNIFSTLHSAGKIALALQATLNEADLVIVDEAHNLTKEAWSKWLEELTFKRQLYFTATRKISPNKDGTGKAMDNREYFGDILYTITPKELIDTGRIVPPRMHWMYPTANVDLRHVKNELHAEVLMIAAGALKHAEIMADNPARIIVFCGSAETAHDFAELDALQIALPGWTFGAVTSLVTRMGKRKRRGLFEDFSKSHRSILFHYDVISEGVDLPGTTAILPLREMGEIKIVQAIGRALRVIPEDRKAFAEGKIIARDSNGWKKPYGWILLPILGQKYDLAEERVRFWVYSLRSANFDFDVERMTVVEEPRSHRERNAEFDLPDKMDTVGDLFKGLEKDLKRVASAVRHELEAEVELATHDMPRLSPIQSGIFNRLSKR